MFNAQFRSYRAYVPLRLLLVAVLALGLLPPAQHASAAQLPDEVALRYLQGRVDAVLNANPSSAIVPIAPGSQSLRSFVGRTLAEFAATRRSLGTLGTRTQLFVNGVKATGRGWLVYGTDAYWFDRPNVGGGTGSGQFATLADPVLTAAVAFTHELAIEPGSSGLEVVRDAHLMFGDRSPDYHLPMGGLGAMVPAEGIATGSRSAAPAAYNLWPDGMRAYASWFWGPNDSNYNIIFDNYNSAGGDCVNFVSQAINYGNMPMQSETIPNKDFGCWNCWWYSNSAEPYPHSGVPWRYVPSHMNYLVTSGRGSWEPGPQQIGIGDPIYFDWTSDGTYDHGVMVSGIDASWNRLVAAHLTNMFDFPYANISGGARKFVHNWLSGTP